MQHIIQNIPFDQGLITTMRINLGTIHYP